MKAAILLTLTLLTSAVFADGYSYPGPGPGYDVCNMDYNGGFQSGGGPLTVSLRSYNDGSAGISVVVYYQNQQYFGDGVCDYHGVDFTLQNGFRHLGNFENGNRGWRINGSLYYNGYLRDRFFVYQY